MIHNFGIYKMYDYFDKNELEKLNFKYKLLLLCNLAKYSLPRTIFWW